MANPFLAFHYGMTALVRPIDTCVLSRQDPGKPLYMLVMKMYEFLAQNSKSYS
jgi:hypothetical protein